MNLSVLTLCHYNHCRERADRALRVSKPQTCLGILHKASLSEVIVAHTHAALERLRVDELV